MREIKFRVLEGEKVVSLSKAIYLDLVCIQYNSNDCFEIEPVFCDVKIMQFTGLTDKNGVEIYEGDLIKNTKGRICDVRWNKHLASFDAIFISDDGSSLPFEDKSFGFRSGELGRHIEVIGNIHENPELSKGAK